MSARDRPLVADDLLQPLRRDVELVRESLGAVRIGGSGALGVLGAHVPGDGAPQMMRGVAVALTPDRGSGAGG